MPYTYSETAVGPAGGWYCRAGPLQRSTSKARPPPDEEPPLELAWVAHQAAMPLGPPEELDELDEVGEEEDVDEVEVVDDEGDVDPPVDEVCEVDPPVDVDVPVAFPPVPPGLPLPPLPPPQAARTSAAPRVAPQTGARDESRLRMTHL